MADATLRWAINLAEWQPSKERMQQLLALLSPLEQQQVLGVPWHTIDIARTAGNRPYIANAVHRPNAPNFNYNVSHEGHWVVLASEPLCAVGCDVCAPRSLSRGAQRPVDEWLRSFQGQLTPEEWETVQGAGPDEADKERVFRQFWCLKEAFVKARGDGIAFDLSKAGFTIAGTKRQLSATLHLDGVVQHGWRFVLEQLAGEHWVAVCRGPPNAVVDAQGGFRATFQHPDLSPPELQGALMARNPLFEELSVSDILPDNL